MNHLDLFDITKGIMDDRKAIDQNIKALWALAERKATADYEYRKALAINTEELRMEKIPVTLIRDLVEGRIADKRRELELSSAQYQASKASLEALQTSVNALMAILKHFEKV